MGSQAQPSAMNLAKNNITPNISKLVRRRATDSQARDSRELERRRVGTIGMALIAIFLLMHRRLNYDSLIVMTGESICSLALLIVAYRLTSLSVKKQWKDIGVCPVWMSNSLRTLCILSVVAMPWIVNPIAKKFGGGNGLEIVMLTCLGWGGLAMAILATQVRMLSLSVVCSGFLALFATFISDSSRALWLSLSWGILCLWWLVSNHWAQVETATAVGIQPSRWKRIIFTMVGCMVFFVGASLVAGRMPLTRKLQTELMPTSGGTVGKDSAARSGVGNGDALIAAKKHATSFGAVDTDMFLDSEEPSLFDMFSEEFGLPKKRKRHESAQALSPKEVQSQDGKFTEANRSASGSEFSIDRELPEERKPIHDLVSESLMFWQGESDVHLAAQRFSHFDGATWSNTKTRPQASTRSIECTVIGKQSWFGPSGTSVRNSISPFVGALPEAMKFTRYRSPTIPSRQGMQLWCIDQINRQDFFAISLDDCLQMPDREHVPDYTVVRMINSRIDLERLEDLVQNCSPGKSHNQLSDTCLLELNRLAHEYSGNRTRGWQQVQAIISGLRSQFVLDRSVCLDASNSTSAWESLALAAFLENRRGPDYLFATTAALMLDHLGYRTRFVAGFYANPKHYFAREGEIAILPNDVHAWLEIDVGHGYWIPLEPTPGYRPPQYSASIWYRLKEKRWAVALGTAIFSAMVICVYLLRRVLVEWVSWMSFPILLSLNDRRRIAWLTCLLDVRCHLAGIPRSKGTVAARAFETLWNLFTKRSHEPNSTLSGIGGSNVVWWIMQSVEERSSGNCSSVAWPNNKDVAARNQTNERRTVGMNAIQESISVSSNSKRSIDLLRSRLNQVLLGKADRMELVIACLLAGGHLLLDDLPGLGKTTLAKAIAHCFGAKFARIQCTPDLLPTDVTGFNMFNQKTREFEFHHGPVFSEILLADEINRTTPRTQSALFEAMAERQVTLDGESRPLSAIFFVIATQNPIESHGAYPLPEAQLDRFANEA